MVNTVAQNTWITIVATYHLTTLGTIQLQVYTNQSQTVRTALRSNRTATYSYVGRSAVAADTYFEWLIAGVHVVDALLSSVEITVLAARMRAGTDPLAGCAARPAGMTGLCGAKCPADKYASTPNLIAVNPDDLTVWYEFESDAHDTVYNELIMAQVPTAGLLGVFTYTLPAGG